MYEKKYAPIGQGFMIVGSANAECSNEKTSTEFT
jgi:hypothetical protein